MFHEVKSRSKMYREIKWFSMTSYGVDPCSESLPMFQMLASQVDFIEKRLISNLSGQVITLVCENISNFYIRDIILVNQFNEEGCDQIKTDVERGVNAIFSQHVLDESKLESYIQLKEVISLLNLKQANALLLMESLGDAKQAKNHKEILAEIGLNSLDSDQALKILRRRVDMK